MRGGIDATAADGEVSQIRSYPSQHGGSSASAGWEYVLGLGLEREAPRIGEQAAALLRAPICPAATTTVVLDSDQVALQVHESVGPPDRARPHLRHGGRVRRHELPPRRETSAPCATAPS